MVNYFIYATDDSNSTNGNDYFNTKGLETLKNFNEEVKGIQNNATDNHKDNRIVYLHWSHRCVRVEEDEVILRYSQKNGEGKKTLPHTVLDWMTENLNENDSVQLLYVVTDGAVYPSDIRPCDRHMKIDNVTFYAFNSNVKNIDMSVASMFMCDNIRYIVYCNEELVDETDLSNPFDYDQINIENFKDQIQQLRSYIKLQFLTKNSSDQIALDEIKKLKCLQTRLYTALVAAQKEPKELINLNVKDRESFIEQFKRTTFYKTLKNPDHYDAKQNIESCIGTLINFINNDKKSFAFDNLKFDQKFIPITEEEGLNINYKIEKEISFPDIIMLNKAGVPVILLTHYSLILKILHKNWRHSGTPIFSRTGQFSRFRKTIECPLFLLLDNLLRDSIEYYYNLEAFKSMIEHGVQTGPRTRKRFTGAIVPLEEFDDYNDYILSCTYFEKRRVPYNKGLFYYVLYKTCESLEYMEPNVVEYLKEYVIKRMAKSKCYLSLSRVSIEDPLIRVDLTTALWYCVELSSIIFKDDPKHFTKEKMRMYSSYADYMKEILEWFHYDIDTNLVDLRANIFRNVNKLKRISRPADKAMFILRQIFENNNYFLIAEIVNPDDIYKLKYLPMDHRKVIDESLLSAEVDWHKFVHFMDHVETTDVPVCKQTMRPYFVTEDNKSFYEQLKMKTRKVLIRDGKLTLEPVDRLDFTRILSLNNLYIAYVKQYLQFPSISEYQMFVLSKKEYFRGKPVVFAKNTFASIENTFASYEKIITDIEDPIDVPKFIEITKSSVNRENRIKQENPIDFNMNEIPNFIKKSERNVKFNNEGNDTSWFCVLL